jgi:hypothetical protein
MLELPDHVRCYTQLHEQPMAQSSAGSDLIGKSNKNPLLDTSVYEVEFDSSEAEAYHTNIIAESTFNAMT